MARVVRLASCVCLTMVLAACRGAPAATPSPGTALPSQSTRSALPLEPRAAATQAPTETPLAVTTGMGKRLVVPEPRSTVTGASRQGDTSVVSSTATPLSTPLNDEIIVTEDSPALPPGCTAAQVARLIVDFLDAYNRGDQDQLAQSFSFGSSFKWYSDSYRLNGRRQHVAAYTQQDLLAYFSSRHQQDEHLQLLMVDVAGPSWHGGVDIVYVLRRTADDIAFSAGQGIFVQGKGAIDCKQRKIFVWSMAAHTPPWPCPTPTGWKPGTTTVACARK